MLRLDRTRPSGGGGDGRRSCLDVKFVSRQGVVPLNDDDVFGQTVTLDKPTGGETKSGPLGCHTRVVSASATPGR